MQFDNLRLKGNIAAGIPETSSKEMIRIYPNPSPGRILVSYTDKSMRHPSSTFTLRDMTGKFVYKTHINRDTELVPEIADGFYVYEINQDGIVLQTGRLVIGK